MLFYIIGLGCSGPGPLVGKLPDDTGTVQTGDTSNDSDTADTQDSVTDTSETGDTSDTSVVPGPCSDGGWGALDETALVVLVGGDDTVADGSLSAPFGTIMGAVLYSRSNGNKAILVGPGLFNENLYLQSMETDLVISGCGSSETELWADYRTAVIYAQYSTGLYLQKMTITGGDDGITVDAASITLTELVISGAGSRGIYVNSGGALAATSILVESSGSYGIDVETSSTALLYNIGVFGVGRAGIFNSGGLLDLKNVVVSDTLSTPGFGVYVGEGGSLSADTLTVAGGMNAGIMGYTASSIVLSNVEISGVIAPDTSLEAHDQHADAVIVVDGSVSVDGLVVTDVGRAAFIADGALVTSFQNISATTGYSLQGVGAFLQNGATMSDGTPNPYILVAPGQELDWSWTW